MAPALRPRTSLSVTRRRRGKGKASLLSQPRMKRRRPMSKQPQATYTPPPRTPSPAPPLPSNPRAMLLGLPAELRLEIYSYVFDSILIHIHRHNSTVTEQDDGSLAPPRFTWTPCRGTHPTSPLLCANPKWSGLCEEADRCTFKPYAPPEVTGFAALTWTCRFIRQETQEFFLRNTTVSIHPLDVTPWLRHLEKHAPSHIELIRRVTIAGPDNYNMNIDPALDQVANRLPNLEAIGFQGQVPKWTMNTPGNSFRFNPQLMWRQWHIATYMRRFDRSITVVMEGFVWVKPRRHWANGPPNDEQSVFRIVREGRPNENMAQGSGWDDADVEIESHTSGLVAYKRIAKWRRWWRGKEVKYFG